MLRGRRYPPRLHVLKNKVSSSPPPPPPPWKQMIRFPEYKIRTCSPQPCRGLVCFTAYTPEVPDMVTIVAVNPATREFRELPKFSCIKDFSMALSSSYIVFDPSSNSYKVLSLCTAVAATLEDNNFLKMLFVINMVSDVSWRKAVLPNDDAEEDECWVFPSLHHGIPYRFSSRNGDQVKVLIFYAQHENFLTFNFFHAKAYDSEHLRTMAACQGSIYVFSSCGLKEDKILHVWVMKDYKTSKMLVEENAYNLQSLYDGTTTSTEEEEERPLWRIATHGVIDDCIVLKIERLILTNGKLDAVYAIYNTVDKGLQRFEVADNELMESMEASFAARGELYESLVSPNRGY